jgi:hypothetical protein
MAYAARWAARLPAYGASPLNCTEVLKVRRDGALTHQYQLEPMVMGRHWYYGTNPILIR